MTITFEGARVVAESESTERPARADDGDSISYVPAADALHAARRAGEPVR